MKILSGKYSGKVECESRQKRNAPLSIPRYHVYCRLFCLFPPVFFCRLSFYHGISSLLSCILLSSPPLSCLKDPPDSRKEAGKTKGKKLGLTCEIR